MAIVEYSAETISFVLDTARTIINNDTFYKTLWFLTSYGMVSNQKITNTNTYCSLKVYKDLVTSTENDGLEIYNLEYAGDKCILKPLLPGTIKSVSIKELEKDYIVNNIELLSSESLNFTESNFDILKRLFFDTHVQYYILFVNVDLVTGFVYYYEKINNTIVFYVMLEHHSTKNVKVEYYMVNSDNLHIQFMRKDHVNINGNECYLQAVVVTPKYKFVKNNHNYITCLPNIKLDKNDGDISRKMYMMNTMLRCFEKIKN